MKRNLCLPVLSALLLSSSLLAQKPPERIITIDYNKVSGKLNTTFNECVGAGRANEGLRADWQQN